MVGKIGLHPQRPAMQLPIRDCRVCQDTAHARRSHGGLGSPGGIRSRWQPLVFPDKLRQEQECRNLPPRTGSGVQGR